MPTLVLPSPYPTATAQRELDCQLKSQSPANGVTFEPKAVFNIGWKVINTGSAVWLPANVEFAYLAGVRPSDDTVIHLQSSVSPRQAVVLTVQMRAPKNPTGYTTRWSLRKGDTYFCSLSLSFYVE